ncbi:MAG TPA: protein kinase, partial [Polyangiales bacterium]|nr:protein kinase [Polyangiales bacterium]
MTAPLSERAERFVFQERLGAGASGSVHRAYDKQRGATVAVKVLAQLDPGSVYRFKAEFRALTGIAHPNLMQLYDLVLQGSEWLLTMELVEGGDFLRHVRPLRTPSTPPDAELLASELDNTLGPEHFEPAVLGRATANDNVQASSSRPAPASAQLGPLDE